jgi:S-adenosylmethionine:tRNA ribosyltransferase-isomerase
LRVDLFDYELPEERIAQRPLEDRAASRLLVLERASGEISHRRFREIASLLPPRSLLVLNDTSVIPARLIGRKSGSGGRTEILLLHRIGSELDPLAPAKSGEARWGRWAALVTASKKIRPGLTVELEGGRATVVERLPEEGTFAVDLDGGGDLAAGLSRAGAPPLPPYIRRPEGPDAADLARYQTVFAQRPGAAAAPTAGLHFTPEILSQVADAGHEIARVTLHVGAGTFLPVRADDTDGHRMHVERYDVPVATADAVAGARVAGRKVVAVGTTSLRALESAAAFGGVRAGPGATDLFITPGYAFRTVDALLTNFHQPRSTLVMLVAAFAGLERIRAAYAEALHEGYRFLSYGDATLIR